jgi:flagellar biosynthesis/type III secretory pathway protein FliH
MEIASETQVRNTISKSEPVSETFENEGDELESEKEILAKKAEAEKRKVEEEENLQALEEKTKEDERILQEQKKKELYDKAFEDGKSASELEQKKQLDNSLLALDNARKSMLDLNASHFIKLRDQIASQILNLSSERAGIEIKALPEIFLTKIETLLETIGQTTEKPIVFLNSDDLESIRPSIKNQEDNIGLTFKSRDDLTNGDIVIEIGSILIQDTAAERSGISNDKNTYISKPERITHEQDSVDEEILSSQNDPAKDN